MLAPLIGAERRQRALANREPFVGHNQIRVESGYAPEALALGACPHRTVKAKHERCGLLELHSVALKAGTEVELRSRTAGVITPAAGHLHDASAFPHIERLLDGFGHAGASRRIAVLHLEPVDKHQQSLAPVVVDFARRGVVQVEDLGALATLGLFFGRHQ